MVDVTWKNEQEVFSELCHIVEETIELYQREWQVTACSDRPEKTMLHKMLKISLKSCCVLTTAMGFFLFITQVAS